MDPQLQPSDYDDLIQILDDVKTERDKLLKVLGKINEKFLYGRDVADEEMMDELHRILEGEI